MEPLLIILVPGVFGGLVLALLMAGIRWGTPSTVVPRRLAPPTPALINMAHIPVEGVGGLGIVAAVVAVAVTDPRIRLAMIVAAVLGAGLALALIAMRRRTGALPSNGDGPDDRSMLHLDAERRTSLPGVRGSIDRLQSVASACRRKMGSDQSRVEPHIPNPESRIPEAGSGRHRVLAIRALSVSAWSRVAGWRSASSM